MEAIKDTINVVLRGLEKAHKRALRGDDPQGWAKKVLTKKELQHIKVNNFKRGVLSFKVDSSSWLYNFNLHKEELLKKLMRESKNVKDIRFYLGDVT